MSSNKPQTRGLAALLRLEKERRAREEAEGANASAPPPQGEQDQPAQIRAVPPAVAPEAAVAAEADESAPETRPADDESSAATSAEAAAPVVTVEQIPPPTGERRTEAAASPPRPTSVRPLRAARKRGEAPIAAQPLADQGWEKFVADWKPFLRDGLKFKLCEFFYRNTAALGKREFVTSTGQLARISGAHRRHIFFVLRQLEELRFIRREGIETNRKDQGMVIHFYPDRQA